MDTDAVQAFVKQYMDWLMAGAGLLLIAGAVMDWDCLCNPQGTPYAWQYGGSRGMRRLIFTALGAVLLLAGGWLILKK